MTTAKHTPGQWTHAKHLIGDGYRVFVDHGNGQDMHDAIADLETWQTDEQTEANARLIAAAPDLLEALERLEQAAIDLIEISPGTDAENILAAGIELARAAIAKAKGEPNA